MRYGVWGLGVGVSGRGWEDETDKSRAMLHPRKTGPMLSRIYDVHFVHYGPLMSILSDPSENSECGPQTPNPIPHTPILPLLVNTPASRGVISLTGELCLSKIEGPRLLRSDRIVCLREDVWLVSDERKSS